MAQVSDRRKRAGCAPKVSAAQAQQPRVLGLPATRSGMAGEGFDRALTDLMLRFQASRDPQDFEQLYRAAAEDVLNWIRSLLRQASHGLDALELLQDTFVNVYRYPSGFRSDHAGSFRVWVRTIAGNAVRRARRRSTQRTANLEEQVVELTDPCASPLLEAYGREASEHMGQALLLLYAALNAAYGRLKERDRQALELVELNGQSYADAGPLLGVPTENMKMIVFRARRRLVQDAARALAPAGSGELLHGLLRAMAG
jgi:RNA polymerase sigma-70 factor (ECF subfamily)